MSERRRVAFVVAEVAAAAGALGYLAVRCGFGTYPALQVLLDISVAYPTILALIPMAQYLHYSPAGPWLAQLVGVETRVSYQVLHVAFMLLALVVLIGVIVRRHGRNVAWMVVIALLTSQVAVVSAAWLGSYDAFTWVIGTAIVLARNHVASALVGFLGAFAAFEQTLVSVVLLAVVTAAGRPARQNHYVPALAGLLLGRLWLTIALRANGAEHDRFYYLRQSGPSRFIEQFTSQLPLFVLTAFGGAWIVLIYCLRALPSRERNRWIVALVVAVGPCTLGEDQTRIYALVTWPLLVAIMLRAGPSLTQFQLRQANALSLIAGLVIPPIYLWAGAAYLAEHHIWHVLS